MWLTLSVDLDICNQAKLRERLSQVCVRSVLGDVSHVHTTVVRVSSIYSCMVKAACVLLMLCPATPSAPVTHKQSHSEMCSTSP